MSPEAISVSGWILITIPTIQFGGYFLLSTFSPRHPLHTQNPMRRGYFRAGHAHAGVLVLLALIAQPLVDLIDVAEGVAWALRLGFPSAAILVSAGFFAAAPAEESKQPRSHLLLYAGVVVLALSALGLGVSLVLL